jgi:hypothetical protein
VIDWLWYRSICPLPPNTLRSADEEFFDTGLSRRLSPLSWT